MAASYVLGTSSLVKGSMLDFTSAPLASLVSNPLQSSLDCAQFEVQNSGRVNTSILETEQIQLKPGSLLTAITLGESIEATNGCNFISFLNATPAVSCGAAATLTLGNTAAGASVVINTTADTVAVNGAFSAQMARVGTAQIALGGTSVSVVDAAITASSVVLVQVVGAAPDGTAKSFSVSPQVGVGFDIVADAASTAAVNLVYFIAKY
jgi:hypothetical protein